MRVLDLVGAFLAGASLATALQAIEAIGNKFFGVDDGKQFFMKGVAYQLTPEDPLIDTNQCRLDANLMKELGVNAIRVYHVDPAGDHDGCMSVFDKAGIYVTLDLDTFTTYVEAGAPSWDQRKFANYSAVMDAFAGYGNVLGFYIGNENISQKKHSIVAPFLKAAARDMKAYRDTRKYRRIPVGYSAADIVELRPMLQNYLTCGGNASETVDFFALNSYSWCDPSTYVQSDYVRLQEHAVDFPVPIFFSETGCNTPGPRLFDDQNTIFGENMTADWSGSIVYEWIYEVNAYGLIGYNSPDPAAPTADPAAGAVDGFLRKGTPIPKQPDFSNLAAKWKTLSPRGIAKSDYDPAHVSTRDCPTSTADGWWEVDGNVALPTLGETFQGGPFTTSPTATGSGVRPTGRDDGNPSSAAPSPGTTSDSDADNDAAAITGAGRHAAAVVVGLVTTMILFTVWL